MVAWFVFQPSYLFVVPSLMLFLASHPAVKAEHLSSVKEVTSGAAPATKSLIDKFREKVGRNDIAIRQGTASKRTTLLMCLHKKCYSIVNCWFVQLVECS